MACCQAASGTSAAASPPGSPTRTPSRSPSPGVLSIRTFGPRWTLSSGRGYADLIDRARAPEPDDEEISVFKAELREALADPGRLPDDELFKAVDYADGSDERFLRRVWRDLYGD